MTIIYGSSNVTNTKHLFVIKSTITLIKKEQKCIIGRYHIGTSLLRNSLNEWIAPYSFSIEILYVFGGPVVEFYSQKSAIFCAVVRPLRDNFSLCASRI